MKPQQPYHSLTSLYREFGGLFSLDYLIAKIDEYAETHRNPHPQILIVNDDGLRYCLALAVSGYDITCLFTSETIAKKAEDYSRETGVNLTAKVGNPNTQNHEAYDIILFLERSGDPQTIKSSLQGIAKSLKNHGSLFISACQIPDKKSNNRFADFLQAIRSNKFRVYSVCNISFFKKDNFAKKLNKKAKGLFHFLDKIFSSLLQYLPPKMSRSWIIECHLAKESKLAIQLLPTFYAGGGAERLAMQIAELLPRYGFDSLMVANVRGGALTDEFRQKGIDYIIISRHGAFGRIKSLFLQYRFFQLIQPDVINTHLFAADFWGRWAARRAKCKNIITTIHNVKTDFGKIGEFIMRRMNKYSKVYIAISNEVSTYMQKSLKIRSRQVKLIPNGIRINEIKSRGNRSFHDVPKILFVGRLEPQKNPDVLLKALAKVRQSWTCDIIGSGSMESYLRHLADDLNIVSRVNFLGMQSGVGSIYANYDLLCFPSQYEGVGLVALEAAVAGLPMIVSDLPVMRELFNSQAAAFVKPGDPEDLAEAINKVLQNPSDAIYRARRLSEQDWSEYSIDAMVGSYAEVYGKIS
ncbi:MAG: glycosyltransferase family 4 protein [Patescibacteria group bacterium]